MREWRLFLLVVLVGALALVTNADRNLAWGQAEQDADAGDVRILVFNVGTKPEGEVVNLTPDGSSTMRTTDSFTAVKQFRIGADGTFKFEGCDCGFFHSDLVVNRLNGQSHFVTNAQTLLRGSGKWRPAGDGEDEGNEKGHPLTPPASDRPTLRVHAGLVRCLIWQDRR